MPPSTTSSCPVFQEDLSQNYYIVKQQMKYFFSKIRKLCNVGLLLLPFLTVNIVLCMASVGFQAWVMAMAQGTEYYRFDCDGFTSKNPYIQAQICKPITKTIFPYHSCVEATGLCLLCVILYMTTTVLGFSTFYAPTKTLLTSTMILSSLSALAALIAGTVAKLTADFNSFKTFQEKNFPSFLKDGYFHDWIRIQKVLMYLAILAGINNTIILAVAILAVQFKKFENKEALIRAKDEIDSSPPEYRATDSKQFAQNPLHAIYQPTGTGQRTRSNERNRSKRDFQKFTKTQGTTYED